jgi:hypothetical protein
MRINQLFKIGIVCSLLGLVLSAQAQHDDVSITYHQAPNTVKDTSITPFKQDAILEKIAIGGTVYLAFGSATAIELSPDVSYHFNKWLSVGVGGTYIFFHEKNNNLHVFGARTFVEGHFFNYIGAYAGYHFLNYDDFYNSALIKDRIWSNNIDMGGGYYRRYDRFSVYLYVLYTMSDREYHPFNYMISYKVGFSVFLK